MTGEEGDYDLGTPTVNEVSECHSKYPLLNSKQKAMQYLE